MKITILGCGPSSGVPAANGFWGNCDSKNQKNSRQRSSILIQYQNKNILIDTATELRQQLLKHKISHIDAVLYTHAHSDHVSGINDISFCRRVLDDGSLSRINAYGSEVTLNKIITMFSYLFRDSEKIAIYQANTLCKQVINHREEFTLFGENILPFAQDHSSCISTGFRFSKFAYSTDVFDLDENAINSLLNLDLWIVACTKLHHSEQSHAGLAKVLTWIDQTKPKMTILTHMGMDMDYDSVSKILPENVIMAYDGMQVEV